MNETQISFAGWLGSDVTVHEVGNGQQVATIRVATTPTRFRDGEWVKGPTTWHTVKAWNGLARNIAASFNVGDPVLVQGRLVADVWERDGKSVTSYQVVASAIGHDLTHGTSRFTKSEPRPRTESAPADDSRAA